MILVLLYRFSESPDSLVGYKLCQVLAKQGEKLLVTTTTPRGPLLECEVQKAQELTKELRGSIGILLPQYSHEQPSLEWIATDYKKYFWYLSTLPNIDMIIGTLPGTTQTAVELKLALGCRLVLLTTVKIHVDKKDRLKQLVREAEEIWSFGIDTVEHYKATLPENEGFPLTKHREIFAQPAKSSKKYVGVEGNRKTFVSQWMDGFPYIRRTHRTTSNGSNERNFAVFAAVLDEIHIRNNGTSQDHLSWKVYGLKSKPETKEFLEKYVTLETTDQILTLDNFNWNKCFAFIAPDIADESFNFAALTAVWKGVPTIVSSRSSVGRFLIDLKDCPFSTRAVVELSGDEKVDKEIWLEKLNNEILGGDANPIRWAKQLSRYLHRNSNIWEKILDRRPFPRVCPYHIGSLLENYCKECGIPICDTCKCHSSHNTATLDETFKNLENRCLKELSSCEKNDEEVRDKLKKVEEKRDVYKQATMMEKQGIEKQYDNIQQRLSAFKKLQLEKINAFEKKQLASIDAQIGYLKDYSADNQEVNQILQQPKSSYLISRCNYLLSRSETLRKLNLETPLKKYVYFPPSHGSELVTEKYYDFLHDHVLGHFDLGRSEPKGLKSEISDVQGLETLTHESQDTEDKKDTAKNGIPEMQEFLGKTFPQVEEQRSTSAEGSIPKTSYAILQLQLVSNTKSNPPSTEQISESDEVESIGFSENKIRHCIEKSQKLSEDMGNELTEIEKGAESSEPMRLKSEMSDIQQLETSAEESTLKTSYASLPQQLVSDTKSTPPSTEQADEEVEILGFRENKKHHIIEKSPNLSEDMANELKEIEKEVESLFEKLRDEITKHKDRIKCELESCKEDHMDQLKKEKDECLQKLQEKRDQIKTFRTDIKNTEERVGDEKDFAKYDIECHVPSIPHESYRHFTNELKKKGEDITDQWKHIQFPCLFRYGSLKDSSRSFPSVVSVQSRTEQRSETMSKVNLRFEELHGESVNWHAKQLSAKLLSTLEIKNFKTLERFHTAVFHENNLWVGGCHKDGLVFLNVKSQEIHKQKALPGEMPIFMIPSGKIIIFAMKGGRDVKRFKIESNKIKNVHKNKFAISGMCGDENQFYVLGTEKSERIIEFDGNWKKTGTISTGLGNIQECTVDMCLLTRKKETQQLRGADVQDTSKSIVVSTSAPHPSVRIVNKAQGVIWCLNRASHPELNLQFDPSSVASSDETIFFAERHSHRVCLFQIRLLLL